MPSHTRRAVLALTGAAALAACGSKDRTDAAVAPSPSGYVSPDGPEVAATERARGTDGTVREVRLTAIECPVELGAGRTVRTWTYNGELPGPEIRLAAGEILSVPVFNHLPESTSAHWHGLAIRNDMDGVPGLTQEPIEPGAGFNYRFKVTRPGTHWFHPHTGVQLDRGLYGPLIIEDPREPLHYDSEWTVLLDDWVDGVDGSTPDAVLAELKGHRAPSPSRMLMSGHSTLLGRVPGNVKYPLYLVNGRTADDPVVFRATPGERIRIRFINAGSDTAFRVALGGHEMTVTHTDGFPVRHARTDALLIGMAERYDVLVTAGDGVFPLTAVAEGKDDAGLAILRTATGAAPSPGVRPAELDRTLLTADRLLADDSVSLPGRRPDRTIRLTLTGSMARYDWGFNGEPYDPEARHPVRAGERVRIILRNHTKMWHPIHLHGHTFGLPDGGARKDTVIVVPGQSLSVDLNADNPGLWMLHCHNLYHSESGMMTVLGYQA